MKLKEVFAVNFKRIGSSVKSRHQLKYMDENELMWLKM